MTTTCQICGRPIKAAKGYIAHHGYNRPGYGYQTASCFGAGFQPYEQGHNGLDAFIVRIEGDILPRLHASLADFIANPPEKIVHRSFRGTIERTRPEDFDAERDRYAAGYANLYWRRQSELRDQITGWQHDLEVIKERRAAWKAPA